MRVDVRSKIAQIRSSTHKGSGYASGIELPTSDF